MVTSYDREYQITKLIKQGKAILESPFAELAVWIASKWHVRVLNIIYDQIAAPEKRPRLQVIVEHSRERKVFFEGFNFDQLKQQAIAARFQELVSRMDSDRYSADRLLVVFSAFAPLAREEADENIAESEVALLQEQIADPDLWTIHRCFGRVTFMFYTDEQARIHAKAGLRESYADPYFELLHQRDEFSYLSRSRFSIEFDSKENFDKTFGGSWFNYDR